MNNLFLAMYVKFQNLMTREEGQDLVEYALLVCLVALAAITGVQKVATAVTTVFTNISSSLAAA
jgi:pilus assembly protein Flp/PilA